MTALRDVGSSSQRVPFKKGFLSGDLDVLESVRFVGSRCRACGVRLLGRRHRCENCSSRDLDDETYPSTGAIFTYTVQRYPPPAPYPAEDPWRPRPLAWVDLDDGPRILAPVLCDPDEIDIGTRVVARFAPAWDEPEGEVVTFAFYPAAVEG